MIQEIIRAFTLIFVAEMGDKTQILAMAFATRYPVRKVLVGIFIGSLLNHGLAVILGSLLSNIVPVTTLQLIAGIAFIIFALWTLTYEAEEEEKKEKRSSHGPTLTVAIAFFIGELGDKTQLTAITLATDANHLPLILMGTVLGMCVTGAIGIFVGRKLGNKIPELTIKFIASGIFLFFGVLKLIETVPSEYVKPLYIVPFTFLILTIGIYRVRNLLIKRKEGLSSAYVKYAKQLYAYYNHIHEDIDNICLGEQECTYCLGGECIIGHSKEIIEKAIEDLDYQENINFVMNEEVKKKEFDQEAIIDSLVDTLLLLEDIDQERKIESVHVLRQQFELLLLSETITTYKDMNRYLEELQKKNKKIGKIVSETYKKRRIEK